MLTRRAPRALLVAAVAVLVMAASQPAPGFGGSGQTPPPSTTVDGRATGDDVAASVTTTGPTLGGAPYSHHIEIRVPPTCWYSPYLTGAEYAQEWGPGGPSWVNNDRGGYSWENLVFDDYQTYATVDGRWYTPECRPDAPHEYVVDYLRTHPTRFVPATEPPPALDEDIDPRVLVEAARDAMVLPTGTIRWNPELQGSRATVVNVPTFVWVEGAVTEVRVRAEVASGTWAQVDARMSSMTLTADGAEDATCHDAGTPYTAGMTSSTCSIEFYRSSANLLPVKSGQAHPTATLRATANWEASWTSSLSSTPEPLEMEPLTTSAEVPVAEIQTIVTR